MEMKVPTHFSIKMLNMDFKTYNKEYNYEKEFTRDEYIKLYKPTYVSENKDSWVREAYTPKKIRNMYDLRMSKTNLYIRWLEHQVKCNQFIIKYKESKILEK